MHTHTALQSSQRTGSEGVRANKEAFPAATRELGVWPACLMSPVNCVRDVMMSSSRGNPKCLLTVLIVFSPPFPPQCPLFHFIIPPSLVLPTLPNSFSSHISSLFLPHNSSYFLQHSDFHPCRIFPLLLIFFNYCFFFPLSIYYPLLPIK